MSDEKRLPSGGISGVEAHSSPQTKGLPLPVSYEGSLIILKLQRFPQRHLIRFAYALRWWRSISSNGGRPAWPQLLDAFFALHDPTTMNRQGPDWGTQYRSVVFFHSPEQEQRAKAKIEQLTNEGHYKPRRIVTQVVPAETFWKAEEYHQRYLEKRGLASCHI